MCFEHFQQQLYYSFEPSGPGIFDEMNPQDPLVQQCGHLVEQAGWFSPQNSMRQSIPVPPSEPLKNVCAHFVDCIQTGNRSTISPGQLGTDLVAVLVALSHSMQQNGAWVSLTET
jgi:predicted dehydrogenase